MIFAIFLNLDRPQFSLEVSDVSNPYRPVSSSGESSSTANTEGLAAAHWEQALKHFDLGHYHAAEQALNLIVKTTPHNAAAWNILGVALAMQEKHENAVIAFQSSIKSDPQSDKAWLNYANSLDLLGRSEEAIAAYQQANHLNAGIHADFELAAKGIGPSPQRAPADFLRAYYDLYASKYDVHMQALKYGLPERTEALLRALPGLPRGKGLDLGCGTGLAGSAIKPYCDYLVGVDLSPVMLSKAGNRGCYDELAAVEALDYLQEATRLIGSASPFSLVVALDVLIYFGPLGALFHLVAENLANGGYFVLSVEIPESEAANDFQLIPSRRFVHSGEFVVQEAAAVGLVVELGQNVDLRLENGAPVKGCVFALSKP